MVCYALTLTIQKLSVAEEVAASSFVSPVTPSGELPRQMGDQLWMQTEQDRGAEGEKHRVCFLWEPQQSPNEYLNTLLIHTLSLRFFITALHLPLPVSPSCSLWLSDSNLSHVIPPLSLPLLLRLSPAPVVPQGVIK